MKRIAAAMLAAALMLGLTACGVKSTEKQFIAMDTVITFKADGKQAEKALQAAEQQIYALEARLSRTRADSEVTKLNENGQAEVSSTLRHLLLAAKDYCQLTDGTFDITIAPVCDAWGFTTENKQVPDDKTLTELLALVDSGKISVEERDGKAYAALGEGQQIDLGGIAKGYVSDLMEGLYAEYEIERGTVSLGGNVYVKGTKADGSLWQVGIQDPKQPENGALAGMVGLSDAYAVTSGGYQRYFEQDGQVYHHIIDPATGYPADSGLTSVTIVADNESGNGTLCDALSTALFVMGEEKAIDFWRSGVYDFDMVLVTEDGRVVASAGLADSFTPEGGYAYETVS